MNLRRSIELVLLLCALPLSAQEYRQRMEYPVSQRPVSEIVQERTGFLLSYNPTWKIPNWAAYEITCKEVSGEVKRYNRFMPDPAFAQQSADNEDYRNSGWDRGHNAPAGDMKWDSTAMIESCYYSNIYPQNHDLNGGDWHKLERRVRDWACRYERVWVVTGSIVGANPEFIGPHRVVVPHAFFKAVLRYHHGQYAAVGFVMPNRNGPHPLWESALSIDDLELLTGYDFFSNLPDDVENQIESEFQPQQW